MMRLISTIIIIINFVFYIPAWASLETTYYKCVRSGASGTGSGNTWTDAYTDLPASMVRDTTYYIAAGDTYGDQTFDDAVDGTKKIIVKRATTSEHGTDSGWNNAYDGDVKWLEKTWYIGTSYYEFDGVTHPTWPTLEGGYGFYMRMDQTIHYEMFASIRFAPTVTITNVTFKNIEIDHVDAANVPAGKHCAYAFTDTMANTSNWTAVDANLSIVGGYLVVAESGGSNPGKAYVDVSTPNTGEQHSLTFISKKGTAAAGKYMIGTTSDEDAYSSATLSNTDWGLTNAYFTPTETTTRITLQTTDATAGETTFFDSVYVLSCNYSGCAGVYGSTGAQNNITFSYCSMHDAFNLIMTHASSTDWTIDHCYFARNNSNTLQHANMIDTYSMARLVVKNCIFEDATGTGHIMCLGNGSLCSDWEIYGNLFYNTAGYATSCAGRGIAYACNVSKITGDNAGSPTSNVTGLKFYHNTIAYLEGVYGVNYLTAQPGVVITGTGSETNVVFNNLWYQNTEGVSSTVLPRSPYGSHDYNLFLNTILNTTGDSLQAHESQDLTASNPFVSRTDYHLSSAGIPGATLGSPYNIDPDGVTRTYYHIGAYEYAAGSVVHPTITFGSGGSLIMGSGAVMTLQ